MGKSSGSVDIASGLCPSLAAVSCYAVNLPAVLCPSNAEDIVKVTSVRAVQDERCKLSRKVRRGLPHLDLIGRGDREILAIVGELRIAQGLLEVHLSQ